MIFIFVIHTLMLSLVLGLICFAKLNIKINKSISTTYTGIVTVRNSDGDDASDVLALDRTNYQTYDYNNLLDYVQGISCFYEPDGEDIQVNNKVRNYKLLITNSIMKKSVIEAFKNTKKLVFFIPFTTPADANLLTSFHNRLMKTISSSSKNYNYAELKYVEFDNAFETNKVSDNNKPLLNKLMIPMINYDENHYVGDLDREWIIFEENNMLTRRWYHYIDDVKDFFDIYIALFYQINIPFGGITDITDTWTEFSTVKSLDNQNVNLPFGNVYLGVKATADKYKRPYTENTDSLSTINKDYANADFNYMLTNIMPLIPSYGKTIEDIFDTIDNGRSNELKTCNTERSNLQTKLNTWNSENNNRAAIIALIVTTMLFLITTIIFGVMCCIAKRRNKNDNSSDNQHDNKL